MVNFGPGLYRVPSVVDAVQEFQVCLLKDGMAHPRAQLFKSKVQLSYYTIYYTIDILYYTIL